MPGRSHSRSRGSEAERTHQGNSSSTIAREVLSDGTVFREYRNGGGIGGERAKSNADAKLDSSRSQLLLTTTSLLRSALLPANYPHSVTPDYLSFQVYDSLQGLCSYVRGVCSSNAVLSGLGVGSSSSSSSLAAAATVGVARDAVGMIAGFALAATAAPRMDSDAKRWRLVADVSNDVSLVLELVAAPLASAAASFWFRNVECAPSRSSFFSFLPFLSSSSSSSSSCAAATRESSEEQRLRTVLFTLLICVAAAFRALVGVAGGATRAALTAHFCRGSRSDGEDKNSSSNNNAGDVAAKEGAQEAAVTLIGMLFGLVLTTRGGASSSFPRLVTLSFALLTVLHVYFNAKALRCLRLTNLNSARLELVVERMLKVKNKNDDENVVLSPAEAAALEPLWPPPFLDRFFGRCRPKVVLGASLAEVAEAAGKRSVEELLEDDDDEDDLPFVGAFSRAGNCSLVALRSDVDDGDENASWGVAAFVFGLLLSYQKSRGEASRWVRERWIGEGRRRQRGGKSFLAEELLERKGWDRISGGSSGVSLLGQWSSGALRYEIVKTEETRATKRRAGDKVE